MIKHIQIYSRLYITSFAASGKMYLPFKKWYLISIHEGNNPVLNKKTKAIFKNIGMISSMSMGFWDMTEEDYARSKNEYPAATLFNKSQAKRIVSFIDKAQKNPQDSALVVHCMAGISRSGAVGTFACDYCGLDFDAFYKTNPLIMANPHVLRTLMDVSGRRLNDQNMFK